MRYRVGDKARVKGDLVVNDKYGPHNVSFVEPMRRLKGEVVTISEIVAPGANGYRYKLLEDKSLCWWIDEMLEPVYASFAGQIDEMREANDNDRILLTYTGE